MLKSAGSDTASEKSSVRMTRLEREEQCPDDTDSEKSNVRMTRLQREKSSFRMTRLERRAVSG